jgi:hypothetical protein
MATLKDVLQAEQSYRAASRKERLVKEQWQDSKAPPIGLALSGGGIRSATFNLGLIQSFAQHKLLHYFDYLSTVSGGADTSAHG